MSGVDLGKQVGPLPLGAWLAVVGTGLGIAYYGQRGGSPTPAPTDTASSGLDSTSPDAVGVGVNGQWTNVDPPTDPSPTSAPTDNDEWGRRAINDLIATGHDPALSQSAIANGLQGNVMSIQQYALWTLALAHMGAPPFSVDLVVPPVSLPGPVTPHAPAPTHRKVKHGGYWYVIPRKNMTLRDVAKRLYNNGGMFDVIYQANRKGVKRPGAHSKNGWVTGPNVKLTMGRALWIPVVYI